MEQPTAPKPPGAAIGTRELSKRHGRRQAVSGLTFTVESGHPSRMGRGITSRSSIAPRTELLNPS